ncbi:hypothetical protein VNO80_12714 [Phaseolus coccineus]|uniref:Uncharacterized protein n=1 Tax=Phaseolus coccineus TaxID=3886 RepID=A0AAN9N0S6_PHACN
MKVVGEACEVKKWPRVHGGSIVSLGLVNEERSLVFVAEDGGVWMWNVETGEVIMIFGDESITISDMIVIKRNGGGFGDGKGNNNVTIGEGNVLSLLLCYVMNKCLES